MGVPHIFRPEGVTIVTPDDYTVVERPFNFAAMAPPQGRFFRHVFCFDLFDPSGKKVTHENWNEDDRIEIWVRWNEADAKFAAGRGGEPTLMIHWGGKLGWQPTAPVYHPNGHATWGGKACWVIDQWLGEDPGIGWAD